MRIVAEALTFDDVSLVPAYSNVLPRDVDLATRFSRQLKLNIPIVSAAMDTVTESRLAIAMAQMGGLGIVHKNMGIDQQVAEVRNVKKYEAGVIRDPITVGPDTSIREVIQIVRARNISGVPVVEGEQLVGIVTNRDLRFEKKPDDPVRHIMTRKDRLVTVKEGAAEDDVLALLHKHRIEKVLVVKRTGGETAMVEGRDVWADDIVALCAALSLHARPNRAPRTDVAVGALCGAAFVAAASSPRRRSTTARLVSRNKTIRNMIVATPKNCWVSARQKRTAAKSGHIAIRNEQKSTSGESVQNQPESLTDKVWTIAGDYNSTVL